MNHQKNIKPTTVVVTDDNNANLSTRKPRRSIKSEASYLNSLLQSKQAFVTNAGLLGRRLTSDIWNSFGAIKVENNFDHSYIETKLVPGTDSDGTGSVNICHSHGTTSLQKHSRSMCQGTNRAGNTPTTATTNANHQNSSPINNNAASANQNNSVTVVALHPQHHSQARRKVVTKSRTTQPNLKMLVKAVDDLRNEQKELKQKIHDLVNILSANSYVGQIQVISHEDLEKTD